MPSDTRPVKKPLTDARIRSLKPREKPYKVFDTRGLYFLIYPDGRRGWRFKYRYGGREKLLSMGSYPDTSLKLAREKRDEARSVLATKTDPSAKRQAEKRAQLETFEAVAREWLKRSNNSEGTIARAKRRLEFFPQSNDGPKVIQRKAENLEAFKRDAVIAFKSRQSAPGDKYLR